MKRKPKKRIRITKENLDNWPKFRELHANGKVRFDSRERLRYLHGAPVGDMVLVRVRDNGTPIYKESAEEWFDPESAKAEEFEWQ